MEATPLRRNDDPSFVGVAVLKDKQEKTLASFREWAAQEQWFALHRAHYDWWMFPIDEPSGYGFAYTVYEGEVEELNGEARYVSRYLDGARILATAWGWDLAAGNELAVRGAGQSWQNWPVRLYKATKSLQLFGFEAEFQSFRSYGRLLLSRGVSFEYSRDITWLFK